jgi:hypothetical protein
MTAAAARNRDLDVMVFDSLPIPPVYPGALVNFFTMWYICTASVAGGTSVMPGENREGWLERTNRTLQSSVGSAGPAAAASYSLIGAIVVLGGLGYALDRWRGTGPWGLLGGLLLGLVVGFYQLAMTVWHKP